MPPTHPAEGAGGSEQLVGLPETAPHPIHAPLRDGHPQLVAPLPRLFDPVDTGLGEPPVRPPDADPGDLMTYVVLGNPSQQFVFDAGREVRPVHIVLGHCGEREQQQRLGDGPGVVAGEVHRLTRERFDLGRRFVLPDERPDERAKRPGQVHVVAESSRHLQRLTPQGHG